MDSDHDNSDVDHDGSRVSSSDNDDGDDYDYDQEFVTDFSEDPHMVDAVQSETQETGAFEMSTDDEEEEEEEEEEKIYPDPDMYAGMHWNPMARVGESLLKNHPTSPTVLWVVLQLGGLIGAWVFFIIVARAIALFAPVVTIFMPVHWARGLSWAFLFLVFPASSHLLWVDMNRERNRRLLQAFVTKGERPRLFLHDPAAQQQRQAHLAAIRRARAKRNRASRHRPHKRQRARQHAKA
jgi:hypothetical protein